MAVSKKAQPKKKPIKKAAPKKAAKKKETPPRGKSKISAAIGAEIKKKEKAAQKIIGSKKPGYFFLGNQLWKLATKIGRDKIFATPQILWQEAMEYFKHVDENPIIEIDYKGGMAKKVQIPRPRPYTIMGLCVYLGVHSKYFYDFTDSLKDKDDEVSKEFSNIIARIKEICYTQKLDGATAGVFNQSIIAMELGLKEQKEIKHDMGNLTVEIVGPDEEED